MRWLMVLATFIVLLLNGFNPMNARFGDWFIMGALTYGVFLLMMILEIGFRTIAKFLLVPFLLILVGYPLVVAPFAYNLLQTKWPQGERLVATNTGLVVLTQPRGLNTFVSITNTSDNLIETMTVSCRTFDYQGQVVKTSLKQVGQLVEPGGVIDAKVVSSAHYAVNPKVNPLLTTCVESNVEFVISN